MYPKLFCTHIFVFLAINECVRHLRNYQRLLRRKFNACKYLSVWHIWRAFTLVSMYMESARQILTCHIARSFPSQDFFFCFAFWLIYLFIYLFHFCSLNYFLYFCLFILLLCYPQDFSPARYLWRNQISSVEVKVIDWEKDRQTGDSTEVW